MGHTTSRRRFASMALLALVLAACGSTSSNGGASNKTPHPGPSIQTKVVSAAAAGKILQKAGIYPPGKLEVQSGVRLSATRNTTNSYAGVVSSVFSDAADAPTIWQFDTVADARGAFSGSPPALTPDPGDQYLLCGSLVLLGPQPDKMAAAQKALATAIPGCQ
jgi:hypothetical protein